MRRIPARGIALALGQKVSLPDSASHYADKVLRLQRGDRVEVFGDGSAFAGTIVSLAPLVVDLEEALDGLANESPCRVTLFQAIPKKDRFEWLLEKATELGVSRVIPLQTSRSVVRIPASKTASRLERWQRICDEAARQCGRSLAPSVAAPVTLAQALEVERLLVELLLDPANGVPISHIVGRSTGELGAWIGPEGGFTAEEIEAIGERASAVSLGPRVLRSETAGITVIAATQLLTGGME